MSKTLLPWEKNCANLPTLFINGKSKMMKSMWKKAAMAVVLATVAAGQNGQAMWGNNFTVKCMLVCDGENVRHRRDEISSIRLPAASQELLIETVSGMKQYSPTLSKITSEVGSESLREVVSKLSQVALSGQKGGGSFKISLGDFVGEFSFSGEFSEKENAYMWHTSHSFNAGPLTGVNFMFGIVDKNLK